MLINFPQYFQVAGTDSLLVLTVADTGCSPPRKTLRDSVCACSPASRPLNQSENCHMGNCDTAWHSVRLTGLERETKEMDYNVQQFEVHQCMSDDLKFKRRKTLR